MALSVSEPLAPQTYTVPNAGGGTIGLNNVGTVGAQVVGADQIRKSVTFINPNIVGNINLLVFPTTDVNGNSLLGVTFAAPGGGLLLLPAATLTVTGDGAQKAWGAVAQSGGANGITVMTSRT